MEDDREKRAKRLKTMPGRFMAYDPFIMHRGGANTSDLPINNRVFIMLCDPSLPKSEIHEMNETNGTVNYKAALLGGYIRRSKPRLKKGERSDFLYVKKWCYIAMGSKTCHFVPGVYDAYPHTSFSNRNPIYTFIPRQELRAQRRARIDALLSITDDDPGRRKSVVKAKLYEYLYCLGVPLYEVARSLLETSRRWPDLAASLSSMRTWLRREIGRSKRTT